MKREYMKPAMRVVRIQHQHIICTSPGSQMNMRMYSGSSKQTEDEEDVW